MKNKVYKILYELSGIQDVSDDMSLQDDLGMDSLVLVSLLISIEQTFNIHLEESDMNPFELINVSDVITLVERYYE